MDAETILKTDLAISNEFYSNKCDFAYVCNHCTTAWHMTNNYSLILFVYFV